MTFIDWSDSEEMIGLLIEYVADEKNGTLGDPKRQKFLSDLLMDLKKSKLISDRLQKIMNQSIRNSKTMISYFDVHDCIEELKGSNMSKAETKDLLKFLKPFDKDIQDRALWLREFVWDLYPTANELIYDNYNALAFGWSPTIEWATYFVLLPLAEAATMFILDFIGARNSMIQKNVNRWRKSIQIHFWSRAKTHFQRLTLKSL